jgi:hypothetical protein
MNYIYKNENGTHGDFTIGNLYHRADGFERDCVSKGFYVDNTDNFRLIPDEYFKQSDEIRQFKVPFVAHLPRNERIVLAKRWGVTEQTINNWQRPGNYFQPYRLNDALTGMLNCTPRTDVLKPGELSEIAQSHGFYISELSVRWGWHYGGETLTSIVSDPNRVALFWDMLNGMKK